MVPIAQALNISLEQLLQADLKKPAKHRGPSSKLESLMEQVTKLPKRRQQRVTSLMESFTKQEATAS